MKGISLVLLIFVCQLAFGQKVIPLYDGKPAPGSEAWADQEKDQTNQAGELTMVSGVSKPTLTVYTPEKGKANGTAIVICPGGAFRFLTFDKEGTEVAQWFASRGVTAFILKYRLVPEGVDKSNSLSGLASGDYTELDRVNAPYVPLAVADGRQAIKYVRQHASEYGVDTQKIGIIGFSAGGTVTGSVAMTYDKDSRPDFAVPVYAYYPAMLGDKVPDDAPPMFLALGANDDIAKDGIKLYDKWRKAGKTVELHVFQTGGHGFGIRNNMNERSDLWPKLFESWLQDNDFLPTDKK